MICSVQLNKYETAPYSFLLNQILKCNFSVISVSSPKFDWICLIGSQIQSNSSKNTEINKQSHVKFWFNRKNIELFHIQRSIQKLEKVALKSKRTISKLFPIRWLVRYTKYYVGRKVSWATLSRYYVPMSTHVQDIFFSMHCLLRHVAMSLAIQV